MGEAAEEYLLCLGELIAGSALGKLLLAYGSPSEVVRGLDLLQFLFVGSCSFSIVNRGKGECDEPVLGTTQ